jgi:tetratricopeptide (TPR) repeat protein
MALTTKMLLGRCLGVQERYQESEAVMLECCASWDTLKKELHPNFAFEKTLLECYDSPVDATSFVHLSTAQVNVGKPKAAERSCTKAIALIRSSGCPQKNADLVEALGVLSAVLRKLSKFEQAESALLEAVRINLGLTGPVSIQAAVLKRQISEVRFDTGRLEESLSLKREALAIDLQVSQI